MQCQRNWSISQLFIYFYCSLIFVALVVSFSILNEFDAQQVSVPWAHTRLNKMFIIIWLTSEKFPRESRVWENPTVVKHIKLILIIECECMLCVTHIFMSLFFFNHHCVAWTVIRTKWPVSKRLHNFSRIWNSQSQSHFVHWTSECFSFFFFLDTFTKCSPIGVA